MPNYGCRLKIRVVGFDKNLPLGCFFPKNGGPELNLSFLLCLDSVPSPPLISSS